MEYNHGFGFPVHEFSKDILIKSVLNDTLYLSNLSVVDYSILAGVDEHNKEIIVGIIDYIRQYTWDKRLESQVKSVGMIAGKATPTVISPDSYKTRFRAAIDRYFMVVPSSQ